MTPELHDRVINRLVETGADDKPWALAIVAALDGAEHLTAYLDDAKPVKVPAAPKSAAGTGARAEPPGAYVASITVEGFRGIGPAATLTLQPGPGLTLVVGRNGSGKSSFAEGLEFLLTGRNYRWEKRSKVWLEGWRNVHHRERTSLSAELLVEGQGPVTVSRLWKGDEIGRSEASVKRKGKSQQPLDSLGWSDAFVTFRPFLSYNELGSLLEEGPSKLYDALSSVLGLEELIEVQSMLAKARLDRQHQVDEAKEDAAALKTVIEDVARDAGDARLTAAAVALTGKSWDLPALDALAKDDAGGETSELGLLRQLHSLSPPDVPGITAIVERLRAAERAVAEFAGTNAERSRERARLLEEALRFHEKHKAADCPLCGAEQALSGSWRSATQREVARLKQEATACDTADSERKARMREAQKFVSAPPPVFAQAVSLGLKSLAEARRQWGKWSEARDIEPASTLADHLEAHVLEFAEATAALVDEARGEVKRREDVWRPVAISISQWLPKARAAVRASQKIPELKSAEAWWKDASAAVRDERFAPVAERALAVWKQLRLQSNVDLGSIDLEGTGARRKVALKVTVDDTPAEALGVMSQGELHALALSLFLPRATLAESPFRFISIDDPVQSMDPSRVEGLAHALADGARTRQVVVFTHDDRLPEAVRRLGIRATVFAVTRRAKSVVEVRQTRDPVSGYLEAECSIITT